jgi:glycine/D-amino acid oxidase-like deaminating enzyme
VVVGAGIVGCATAYELARRGLRVCLLDRGDVSGGTTGLGEGNVLCSDKRPGAELELAVRGLALYDEIEELLGEEAGVRRKGALVVHLDVERWVAEAGRVEGVRAAGVRCSLLDVDEVLAVEPELQADVLGASFFPDDLQCDPRAVARGLAREAVRLGAEVLTGRAVLSIVVSDGLRRGVGHVPSDISTFRDEPGREEGVRHVPSDTSTLRDEASRGRGVRHVTGDLGRFRDGPPRVEGVTTPAGVLRAEHVVLACGPWSAPLARGAGLELPLEPRKGQLVRLERRPEFLRHKVIDGGYMAAVESEEAGLQVSTVIETTLDGHVLVGSSRERRGFDLSVDPAVSDALIRAARRLAPGIEELAVDSAWSGLRPWLPGGLPAIGPTRAAEGLWIATGHEGAGVAHGPITGRLIAQAICGEQPDLPLAPFDPDRFAHL